RSGHDRLDAAAGQSHQQQAQQPALRRRTIMVAIDIDIITVINWLVAFGIPLLVGLIGRKVKESLGRVILLLVLNAVQTGLGELVRAMQDGTTWSFGTWLFTLLGAIALSTG